VSFTGEGSAAEDEDPSCHTGHFRWRDIGISRFHPEVIPGEKGALME